MPPSDLILRVVARHRIVQRVVARHLEAAEITPEKLQELLLKVRKKATSSFNWKNIADVVTALGGKVTKVVGLVHVDDWMYADSEAEATAKHSELEKHHVSVLPSTPKHGQLYVTKQDAPKEEHGHWSWKAEGAVGNEGWLIEMPNGKSWTALPSQYDVGELRHGKLKPRPAAKISVYDTLSWLTKEGGWVELANEKLAMPALEPSVPRTRENTGTCGVCFQNVKLKAGNPPRIVLHGYKRPGIGYVHGNCSGMGYPPFELSVEATKDHLEKALKPRQKQIAEALHRFKSGQVTEFTRPPQGAWGKEKVIKQGDPDWDRELEQAIRDHERALEYVEADIKVFGELVQHWKVRDLPKEGDRHINWYAEGRK